MRAVLYRFFSGDDLLYVGISLAPLNRIQQHLEFSDWCLRGLVTCITMEHFDSKQSALDAEKAAIIAEKPTHNKMHADGDFLDQGVTKREARDLLEVTSDHALSKALGTSPQAIYQWGEHDPIPRQRVWQIKALLAEKGKQVA